MRLCVWAGARCLLPVLTVLTVLTVLHVKADQQQQQPRERHYYIAAVEIDWKYSRDNEDTHGYEATGLEDFPAVE